MNDAARAELLREGKARQFVRTPHGTMHVRVSGPENGPVVLLVHGGHVGGYVFEKWQRPLADAGYRVVVPDLLGQGYSERPNVPYTKEFYVAQLNELLNRLGISERVNLLGASLGGGIAIAFAGAHPDRIISLNLIAPEGGGEDGERVNDLLLLPAIGDWIFRVPGPRILQGMMADANNDNPSAQRGMVAWMQEQTRYRGYGDGILNSIRNTLSNHGLSWQPDALEAIGRSGVPVIAIWGTKDMIVPFAHSRELQSRIPQLQLVPLSGQGHAINFGREANLLSFILPFLDRVNKSGDESRGEAPKKESAAQELDARQVLTQKP
ncbi:alpha/beta hydrolase [uncultured Pleomorphomonas sp.]|nr:alpha/beta hydrolase [uncultured Pleomorphomonas sp.]